MHKLRWSVYLLRCRGGALYTGIASDVARRLKEHRQGRGAKFLRGKGPLRLVFKQVVGAKGLALRVEYRIKQLPKARKEALLKRKGLLSRVVAQVKARTGSPRQGLPVARGSDGT